ncbi:MAG: serine protease Do [Chitinophagales bacterium]
MVASFFKSILAMRVAMSILNLLWMAACSFLVNAQSIDSSQLFSKLHDSVFQIRIIDIASNQKSSTGTGFVVDEKGTVATNYHVVSNYIERPEKFRIEYETDSGKQGVLTLVDVDVVNDLALLAGKHLASQPFVLAETMPAKGQPIYSMGYPLDLGITVIPGTYNGIPAASIDRVHFSGSLNSGMSGGPSMNAAGHVVGSNVATAGNQVSFLVPVTALKNLLAHYYVNDMVTDFDQRMTEQLTTQQALLINSMLAQQWLTSAIGEASAVGEIPPFIKCWGYTDDNKKNLFDSVSKRCETEQDIYVGRDFRTGKLELEFFWLESVELDIWRFSHEYERIFSSFMPGNRATSDDVGNFSCQQKLISDSNHKADSKAVFCTRAYKHFDGLYDVLFVQGSLANNTKAFISHFTLSGVGMDEATRFIRQFMKVARWDQ